jgi:hypothetical protein
LRLERQVKAWHLLQPAGRAHFFEVKRGVGCLVLAPRGNNYGYESESATFFAARAGS